MQRILIRLLYLTPLGYLLNSLYLLSGNQTKGLKVYLNRYSPITAKVKDKPSFSERVNWLANSIVLFTQGWFVIQHGLGGSLGGAYAITAYIFGGVSIISAVFPKVRWNKSFFKIS